MNDVQILKVATAAPSDVSATDELRERGYSPADVVAVVGKTEGNGCVNDFSRGLASLAWGAVLPAGAVAVMSGGTEGVLSPHVTLLVRCRDDEEPTGLRAAAVVTDPVAKADVGRRPQAEAVADAVRTALADAGLEPDEVDLVLVKCPLLTSADVAACLAAGTPAVTADTYESMAHSRGASALGVALALGECSSAQVDEALAGLRQVWSATASMSSGAEVDGCHVLVLGSSGAGRLRMRHTVMSDALDARSVLDELELIRDASGVVRQVFAKAEADPGGTVRGHRHTMLTDSDLHSTRHARAAVGGLLAGLVGDPALYVSGGAENQGPPGGGPVAIVYEVP